MVGVTAFPQRNSWCAIILFAICSGRGELLILTTIECADVLVFSLRPYAARVTSFIYRRKDQRSLFLDQQDEELCRLCIAGVSSDEMNSFWVLVKCVPGMKCYFSPPFICISIDPFKTYVKALACGGAPDQRRQEGNPP